MMRNGQSQEFTVKIGNLQEAMERLAASLRKKLGVKVEAVTTKDAEKYNLKPNEGVMITSVQSDGRLRGGRHHSGY